MMMLNWYMPGLPPLNGRCRDCGEQTAGQENLCSPCRLDRILDHMMHLAPAQLAAVAREAAAYMRKETAAT